MQNRQISLIGKTHMIHVNAALHIRQRPGVGSVLQGRFFPHQGQEAPKTSSTIGEQLGELGELPDRIDKGSDIQAERNQIHSIHPALHDKPSAGGNHNGREQAEEELHGSVKASHSPMKSPFGGLEAVIGAVEFPQFSVLVGEGFGGTDTRKPGLDIRIDHRRSLLQRRGRFAHRIPALPDHPDKHRHNDQNHQRQPPLNPEHNRKSANDGHAGDKHVLRAMMGELGDIEEVSGQTAHQLSGTVPVVVVEAQLLHMPEEVVTDISLHQDAEGMPPIADNVMEQGPENERDYDNGHNGKKSPVCALRQKLIHTPAGDVGKGQIDQRDKQSAEEVSEEEFPMGDEIRKEDTRSGFLLKVPGCHKEFSLSKNRLQYLCHHTTIFPMKQCTNNEISPNAGAPGDRKFISRGQCRTGNFHPKRRSR